MAAAREIKERIESVKNTLKITNAMYMISSTKMNNARKALANTEPYFFTLQAMFARVLRHLPEDFTHPFLEHRDVENEADLRRAIVCVTADKGLAGAYNHNVLRMTEQNLRPDTNDKLFVIGEYGRAYFERSGIPIDGIIAYTAQKPTIGRARSISAHLLDMYRNHEIDEAYIIFTQMKNAMETETVMTPLLPLTRLEEMKKMMAMVGSIRQEEFEMDPSPAALLENIIPDFVGGYIYSALVESYCAEHSSRMQAMDAAGRNGRELVSELQTTYNRVRQAKITQEITEIAAGAKARREAMERAEQMR